eukprot:4554037-Prymnesium_polylepis.1
MRTTRDRDRAHRIRRERGEAQLQLGARLLEALAEHGTPQCVRPAELEHIVVAKRPDGATAVEDCRAVAVGPTLVEECRPIRRLVGAPRPKLAGGRDDAGAARAARHVGRGHGCERADHHRSRARLLAATAQLPAVVGSPREDEAARREGQHVLGADREALDGVEPDAGDACGLLAKDAVDPSPPRPERRACPLTERAVESRRRAAHELGRLRAHDRSPQRQVVRHRPTRAGEVNVPRRKTALRRNELNQPPDARVGPRRRQRYLAQAEPAVGAG